MWFVRFRFSPTLYWLVNRLCIICSPEKKQNKYNVKFAFLSKRIPLDLVEHGFTTMFTSSVQINIIERIIPE